jgi:predicted MFS family arabinose efflux permease
MSRFRGATSNGLIGQHFQAHAIDHGMTEYVASTALAIMGGLNFVGVLGSGYLTDKYDPRRLLMI